MIAKCSRVGTKMSNRVDGDKSPADTRDGSPNEFLKTPKTMISEKSGKIVLDWSD